LNYFSILQKLHDFYSNIIDPFAKSRKVYFKDDNIPFDGSPFFIIATKVFDCRHGPDRKKASKKKLAQEKVLYVNCV
jgi:hypothetical protein